MRLPDPAERPLLTRPEAGSYLGLGRSASYQSTLLDGIAIETSPGRQCIPTAALVRLIDPQAAAAPRSLDVDALADAVADRLLRRIGELLLLQGEGPVPAGPVAATDNPSGAGHESASHIRAV